MKFGAQYAEALKREEYPPEWIESSISYKKLKKCIKRVQKELLSLGLDHDTLNALWQHVGESTIDTAPHDDPHRMMHYAFSSEPGVRFVPKLTIALDPKDGSPMDAWLSPETKKVLRRVGHRQSSAKSEATEVNGTRHASVATTATDTAEDGDKLAQYADEEIETVEVPLTSDSEFFQILRKELSNLEGLQAGEQNDIQAEIDALSNDLKTLKDVSKKDKKKKAQLEGWREMFRLYNDAEVFISSHERDAGVRSANKASEQLQYFTKALARQQENGVKLGNEGNVAMERFVRINAHLLRLLKFQEINKLALTKILKKFDKQTALHAGNQMMQSINEKPAMTRELARRTCFTISDELLKLIPQLDDYLCPVCFSVSYQPVRLKCNHVFCIRCLITLQRRNKDECPLCREPGVLEATANNLDMTLAQFLKENFKDAVKAKQKENEYLAGVDRFGESYKGTHKCVVM